MQVLDQICYCSSASMILNFTPWPVYFYAVSTVQSVLLNHRVCRHVQVFQQALHRQPNTAAQYLQQMYAAQQQHLMLQTAALQQQHNLSTAQLQSLAAVQQVSKHSSNNQSYCAGTITAVNVDLLHACLTLSSCVVTGQYCSWAAKLFTEWHFISANRIYSGYGECRFESWACL